MAKTTETPLSVNFSKNPSKFEALARRLADRTTELKREREKSTGLSHEQLWALAVELNAALPPPEPSDPGERELLQLYRLLDEGRKAATRQYLAAMA